MLSGILSADDWWCIKAGSGDGERVCDAVANSPATGRGGGTASFSHQAGLRTSQGKGLYARGSKVFSTKSMEMYRINSFNDVLFSFRPVFSLGVIITYLF